MITVRGKEITAISVGNRALQAVYHGARLVWQKVKSCFGSGVWLNNKPWFNGDKWKNNR